MDTNLTKMSRRRRAELIMRFGTQVGAAKALGIRENRLSYLVRGHAEPSEGERKALLKGLGKELVRRLFNQGKENHNE